METIVTSSRAAVLCVSQKSPTIICWLPGSHTVTGSPQAAQKVNITPQSMTKYKLSLHRSRNTKRTLSPPPPDLSSIPRLDNDGVPNKEKLAKKIAALGVRGDQGVSKRKGKGKRLSTKQRKRANDAREKAVASLDRLAKKTENSKTRASIVQKRRVSNVPVQWHYNTNHVHQGNWEDLNEKMVLEAEADRLAAVMKNGKVPVA